MGLLVAVSKCCKYRRNTYMARWQKGQSGNPAGRPKGARDALSQAVYKEMLEDWGKHGLATIKQVRETRPELYLQSIIRLVPTAHDLTLDDTRRAISEYSNEELAGMVGVIDKKTAKKAA
jgi:hypothetical protein